MSKLFTSEMIYAVFKLRDAMSHVLILFIIFCRLGLQEKKSVKELVEQEGKPNVKLQRDPSSTWLVSSCFSGCIVVTQLIV